MANTLLQSSWENINTFFRKMKNYSMEKECLAQLESGMKLKDSQYRTLSYSTPIFEKAVILDRFAYRFADTSIKNDEDIAYTALKHTTPLDDFPKHFFNNKKFMMEVLENDHAIGNRGLFYASEALKNDKEIVLYAYKKNIENLYFINDELLNDIEFMTPILQGKYPKIQARIKQEPLVRLMISKNRYDLQQCDMQFRNNKELAIDFITNYDAYIYCFSDEIKDDEDVVWLALQHTAWDYFSISPRLQADKNIIHYCLDQEPENFRHMPDFVRNDKGIVLKVAPHYPDFAQFIGDELKKEIGQADVLEYLLADKLRNELEHSLDNPCVTAKKRRSKI